MENNKYMRYLLDFFREDTFSLLEEVLDDNEEEPEYSAITTINRFWAYIQCEKQIDQSFPFNCVADFLRNKSCCSEEDIALLFKKARIEASIYHGVIYNTEFNEQ